MSNATQSDTLMRPVEVAGESYDVPVPVHVRLMSQQMTITALEAELSALIRTLDRGTLDARFDHVPPPSPAGRSIRELRIASGLTVAQFCGLIDISTKTLYNWENGSTQCPPSAWEILMIGFGKMEPRRFL